MVLARQKRCQKPPQVPSWLENFHQAAGCQRCFGTCCGRRSSCREAAKEGLGLSEGVLEREKAWEVFDTAVF